MANRGVVEFYYTRELPQRAVAIAEVRTQPSTPAQLTDINNTILSAGTLGVWKSSTLDSSPADFIAPDYNVALAISGTTEYRLDNQFFELTDQALLDGTPLFYAHHLEAPDLQEVRIITLAGDLVTDAAYKIVGQTLYHALDGQPYRVRYVTEDGYLKTHILAYGPVISEAPISPGPTKYVLGGRYLTTASNGIMYIRFLAPNGYQALAPYDSPPNTPWFARIRFNLRPLAPEWARQVFLPQRPYMLAVWVPGTVLDKSMVEFERKEIFLDPDHLPDVLVFDKHFELKFAIEGTSPGSPRRRGALFPWKRGLIKADNIDLYKARIDLSVELASDDIVYAFYSYKERDVVYRGVDVNPFTNPAVKNKVVEFYYKEDGTEPFNRIFHRVKDPITGTYLTDLTNDTNPSVTGTQFATLVVGAAVGVQQFTVTDIRVRGGGLAEAWQDIPEAVNFWDLGYWDGKPYPTGGALIVYLPQAILGRMSKSDVESRVQQSLPLGTIPVIRYYTPAGEESV
jgi:hypothetical protein